MTDQAETNGNNKGTVEQVIGVVVDVVFPDGLPEGHRTFRATHPDDPVRRRQCPRRCPE